jgi:hypothetical protein
MRNLYQFTLLDDETCILTYSDQPEDLTSERFNTLKKRVKLVKKRLQVKSLKHENTCIMGKETTSQNKHKLMKICSELERLSKT